MNETNWIMWDFVDQNGESPLKTPAVFDCRISFQYTPTEVVTTETDTAQVDADNISNVIKLTGFDCEHVSTAQEDRLLTTAEKELLNPWVEEVVAQAEKLAFQIKSAALHTITVI